MTIFFFLIQFDCFCDDGILPFGGAGYTTELRFSSGLYMADYGTHFDFDTTSGKTDGKLLTGMKNHFDTAEFSS